MTVSNQFKNIYSFLPWHIIAIQHFFVVYMWMFCVWSILSFYLSCGSSLTGPLINLCDYILLREQNSTRNKFFAVNSSLFFFLPLHVYMHLAVVPYWQCGAMWFAFFSVCETAVFISSPHEFSSLPSVQSSSPSHCHTDGMQRPFPHWNWLVSHSVLAPTEENRQRAYEENWSN